MITFILFLLGLFFLVLSVFIVNDLLISYFTGDNRLRRWWERHMIANVPDDRDI